MRRTPFTRRKASNSPIMRAVANVEVLEPRRLLSAGDLDPTFGVGGKVITDLPGPGQDVVADGAVAVQSDGKIVVAGTTGSTLLLPADSDVAIVRYNVDGSLDASFGDGGRVTTDFGSFDELVGDLAILPDGKILVAGASDGDFALLRYNPTGSLDASFGASGRVTTDFGFRAAAYSMVVQPDGRIVLAGTFAVTSFDLDFALARYNADGSLDPTFGTGGKLTRVEPLRTDTLVDAARQPDGRIVVVGSLAADVVILRLNTDGSMDTSFDFDGRTLGPLNTAGAVTLQPDGKIVVGGSAPGGFGDEFAVARLNSNGSWDNTFGGFFGLVRTPSFGFFELAADVMVQPDGKIVAAGYTGLNDFYAVRYNANGSLDTSFDDNGLVRTNLGSIQDLGAAVALQPDGKIILAGVTGAPAFGPTPTLQDFGVVRYDSNGSLDTSFDSDGIAITTFEGSGFDQSRQIVALQTDGKLLVVGATGAGPTSAASNNFALARYNADGSLDTTFGTDGLVITDFATNSTDSPNAVVVRSDGRIVVAGASAGNFALAGYNADGSPDLTFGVGGKVTTDFGSTADVANSIAIDGFGRLVVAGSASVSGSGTDFALARYDANGVLDPSFDGDGRRTTPIGAGTAADIARAVAIQPNGKIVAAGQAVITGNGNDFAAARFNDDGSLDTTFDGDGKVTSHFVGSTTDLANAMVIQADSKIVLAGHAQDSFALIRYNTNGSLDDGAGTDITAGDSFGTLGRVITFMSAGIDVANSVALQSDGRIVVAGGASGDFAIARYLVDGSLDVSFGVGGQVITDFGSPLDAARSVIIQADGKIVAAGQSRVPGRADDFALARYLNNQPPTAVANGPYSVDEGGSVALSASGSDDPDEGAATLTYAWDLDGDNIFGETGIDAANGDETGSSPTLSAAGLDGPASVAVRLRVIDSFGASDEDTAQITINNIAPAAGTVSAPVDPQLIGSLTVATASFSDAGTLDTHTAVWDWGDSTTSAGTVTESNGSGTVGGSHVYVAAGVYTITLTVSDDDGGSSQSIFQYAVVYNPADGFVTGGGTIDSPAGALVGNPTASGVAQFAFVSRYHHGANPPTGETRFRFNVGDFRFESTSYDWMVISGAKARYRGAGTVNGAGGYSFQITIIDGDRPGGGGFDRYRIKIWSTATNATVYDNQMGGGDNDDPLTALRGGSIRIQT